MNDVMTSQLLRPHCSGTAHHK